MLTQCFSDHGVEAPGQFVAEIGAPAEWIVQFRVLDRAIYKNGHAGNADLRGIVLCQCEVNR